jgi:hypothetical protein
MAQRYRRPESDVPERPITFNAAQDLGAFELAELWADRSAWPVLVRTVYDELAELACMAALGRWLTRWLPIAIHSAMKAGAEPAAVARACGLDVEATFQRWDEWATVQRDFILKGRPGISVEDYDTVRSAFLQRSLSAKIA